MPQLNDNGFFDVDSFDAKPLATAQPEKKKRGGITGFVGDVASGIASPFKWLGDVGSLGVRQTAADLTGNKRASRNVDLDRNRLFGGNDEEEATVGEGLKKLVGNSAGALLTVAAPGVSSIKGAAALGGAGGASSALAQDDSTLNDVVAGGLAGAATGGALRGAEKVVGKIASRGGNKGAGGFMDNLTTQGQQMQARGLGISGGNKVNGVELAPQDSERMLETLKREGIKIGNANVTARDLKTKLDDYGKQIADHFKVNNAPLMPDDINQVADNFLGGIKTTDPRVLKEYQILADDLKKNVKSTKGMWDFRKELDDRIPDSKQATGVTLSNQMRAIKEMRQYLAKELGDIPGMTQYHDLAEIKPFLGKGMRELNQGGNDIWSRVLNSGPVQKLESTVGKGVENIGKMGAEEGATGELSDAVTSRGSQNVFERVLKSRGIPVKYESDEFGGAGVKEQVNRLLINPSVGDAQDAALPLLEKGFSINTKTGMTTARRSVSGRGIPVKTIENEARGTVSPNVINETLTGKNADEVAAVVERMQNAGYSVSVKNGKIQGRKSVDNSTSLPGRASSKAKLTDGESVPVSQVTGSRYDVSLQPSLESTSVLPAKPRSFETIQGSPTVSIQAQRTAIPLAQRGQTERGIINTPDVYEEIMNLPVSEEVKQTLLQRLSASMPAARNYASGIFRQGAAGMAGASMVPESEEMSPELGVEGEQPTSALPMGVDGDILATDKGSDQLGFGGGSAGTDPFSPENIYSSVQSILSKGGTMKDVSEFLANAKVLNDIQAASGGSKKKPLNSTASGVIADTTTGLKQLKKLSGDIAESSANNPGIGWLRGKNPLDTNAQNLQASIATAKQIVGKALEGGVLRAEDEKKYAKILPTLNDTDAVAQHKIEQLIGLISSRLGEYQNNISGGTGGTDMDSLGL